MAWWPSAESYCDVIGSHTARTVNRYYYPFQSYSFNFPGYYTSDNVVPAGSYIEMPSFPNFGTGDFSITFFVLYATRPAPFHCVLVEKYDNVSGAGFSLTKLDSDQIRFETPSFSLASPSPVPIADGQWVNYCITRRGGSFSIYVNGNVLMEGTAPFVSIDAIAALKFGHRSVAVVGERTSYDFVGLMRDIMIFRRALSSAEVKQQSALTDLSSRRYCTPSGAPCPGVDCAATALTSTSTTTVTTQTTVATTMSSYPMPPVVTDSPEGRVGPGTGVIAAIAVTLVLFCSVIMFVGIFVLVRTGNQSPDIIRSWKLCCHETTRCLAFANLCCGPARCGKFYRIFMFSVMMSFSFLGAVFLGIGAAELPKYEGITSGTTCVVARYEVRTETCQRCNSKGSCTTYTCYRGYIYTSCCGYCEVCRANQKIPVYGSSDPGNVENHMYTNWPPGKEFFCYVRPSDGVVALPDEISSTRALVIAGCVFVAFSIPILVWAPMYYCRALHTCAYVEEDHSIGKHFHTSQVKLESGFVKIGEVSIDAPVELSTASRS